MFELVTFNQKVRVPPRLWKEDIKEATRKALRDLEGSISRTDGMLLAVLEIQEIGEGKILPGDGAVYFPAKYKALMFKPEMNEVVDSQVSDMVEFGAFVRIGPMDGLVHISQIADDFFSYSDSGVIQGKQSKRRRLETLLKQHRQRNKRLHVRRLLVLDLKTLVSLLKKV